MASLKFCSQNLEFVVAEAKEGYVQSKSNKGETPLHFAARSGNVKAVEKLLQFVGENEKENYIESANNDNKNALNIAISYDNWKVFYKLLKYIKNLKQKQHYYDLAEQASDSEKRNIHSSDNLQTKGCVKERKKQRNSEVLTSHYSKKRPRISDGNTQKPPVKKVAQQEVKIKSNDLQDVSLQDDVYEEEDENSSSQSNSSPESLDELQNDTINRSLDDTGGTILHLFVRIYHHSAIDDLINSGADVNARDKRGYTPLHFAAIKGYHDIVISLMCKGADVNIQGFDGRTPLEIAETKEHTKCVEYLKSNDLCDVSDESLSVNSYSELQEFVNFKYDKEYNSLHLAVKSNNVQDVKSLIAIGANVSIKATEYEYAPLHFAAERGNKEMVKILIEAGANLGAKTILDYTPLHFAAKGGNEEVVKILIDKGADPNAEDKESKWTALHYAARYGQAEVVKILIEAGAGRKAVAEINKTPFSFIVNALDIGTPSPGTTLNNVALDNQLRKRSLSF